jgi:hypothetical protein
VISGKDTLEAVSYVGTVGTFGFMVAYALVAVAAPVWLARLGEPSVPAVVLGIVSAAAMVYVFYKNVYPAPPSPFDLLPWIFAGLMALGAAWYGIARAGRPAVAEEPMAP